MKYSWFYHLDSEWSWYEHAEDSSEPYPVVEYTHYASSFDEFVQKYPYITLEQCNQAISESTFGNVGTGCGQSKPFETIYFNHTDYNYRPIISEHESNYGYKVGVEIGLSFKREGNILRLPLSCQGFIISDGWYSRSLDFGLSATSVTFYPESYKNIIFQNSIDNFMSNVVKK